MVERIPRRIGASKITDTTLEHGSLSDNVIYISSSAPTAGDDTYAVGTIWVDYTNGATYTCTATGSENASWANQDGDDVNIAPAYMGLNNFFEMGGTANTGAPDQGDVDTISKSPFTAPHPASDWGELAGKRYGGQVAMDSAKSLGMYVGGTSATPSPNTYFTEVTTFPTTSGPVTTTDIGDIDYATRHGSSSWSATRGTIMNGRDTSGPTGAVNTIQDYALASPFSAADKAETTEAVEGSVPSQNTTYSYTHGGWKFPGSTNNIQRYQKATTDNSTDIGEGIAAKYDEIGVTDDINSFGYIIGGGSPEVNEISRYPQAAPPVTAADIGESSSPFIAYGSHHGASSTTHGYYVSRTPPSNNAREKFPFAAPTSTTDIGEASNVPSTSQADYERLCQN